MDDFKQKPEVEEPPENDREEGSKDLPPGLNIYPRISPIAAAFIGLIGGFLLYQVVGGLLTLLIFGLDIKSAPVNSVRLMTMAGQILFILLPALVFAKFFYVDVTQIIRVKFPKWEEVALFFAGIIVLTPLIQYYLSIQNYFINILAQNSSFVHSIKSFLDKLNDSVDKAYGGLLNAHSVLEGLLVIIIVAIVPAFCEETLFRGFIQRSFEFKMKPVWAAFITAVFFALYHFNPYASVPLMMLGFYFGFAAYMSDSIFIPISLHFFNNFLAVIFFFISGNDDIINAAVDKNFDLQSSLLIFTGLLALFGIVVYFIKRYYSKRQYV